MNIVTSAELVKALAETLEELEMRYRWEDSADMENVALSMLRQFVEILEGEL